MASDGNGGDNTRNRRGSITQTALSNLFQRGNSMSGGPPPTGLNESQRRRLSVSTLGLSGGSANQPPSFNVRRSSMSTNSNNSDSIDESAIEDDEGNYGAANRTAPNTPFVRRLSFGGSAMRGYRPSGSPGNGNATPTSPPLPESLFETNENPQGGVSGLRQQQWQQQKQQPSTSAVSAALSASGRRASLAMPRSSSFSLSFQQASHIRHPSASSDNPISRVDQQRFNWSEQLRSRAESSVTSTSIRPTLTTASTSPPRASVHHDRAKSVSDMPQPPVRATKPRAEVTKPDAFQERILKGDFYMD